MENILVDQDKENELVSLVYALGELSLQKEILNRELKKITEDYDNLFTTIEKMVENNNSLP